MWPKYGRTVAVTVIFIVISIITLAGTADTEAVPSTRHIIQLSAGVSIDCLERVVSGMSYYMSNRL